MRSARRANSLVEFMARTNYFHMSVCCQREILTPTRNEKISLLRPGKVRSKLFFVFRDQNSPGSFTFVYCGICWVEMISNDSHILVDRNIVVCR